VGAVKRNNATKHVTSRRLNTGGRGFDSRRLHHKRVFKPLKTQEKAPSVALFSYLNQANTFSKRLSTDITPSPAFSLFLGVYLGV
jgi:hypothetical protein